MQLTGRITRDSLLTLEAYERWRRDHKHEVMAHRRLRTVDVGPHLTVQFESELTMRYQIQEMLRVERIFDEEGIQGELQAYAPLVPDGDNWKATLLIGFLSPEERKARLAGLVGVERRIHVRVDDLDPVYAIADEDLDRSTAGKTSAVHYLRFALPDEVRAALKGGARLVLGCDHPQYQERTAITGEVRESLLSDLR